MLLRCCRCCITTNTAYFLHFNQISNNIYNLNLFNPHTYNLRRRYDNDDDGGDDGSRLESTLWCIWFGKWLKVESVLLLLLLLSLSFY